MLEAVSGATGALISLHIGELSLTLLAMSQEVAFGIVRDVEDPPTLPLTQNMEHTEEFG